MTDVHDIGNRLRKIGKALDADPYRAVRDKGAAERLRDIADEVDALCQDRAATGEQIDKVAENFENLKKVLGG